MKIKILAQFLTSDFDLDKYNEEIAYAIKRINMQSPYFALILMGINKKFDRLSETACAALCGINMTIHYNPNFWNNTDSSYHEAVLLHEILHIAFFHCFQYDRYENKEVANIAADIVVNQYIKDTKEGWMTLQYFETLGLVMEPFKGMDYYYEELMKCKNGNGKNQDGSSNQDAKDMIESMCKAHDNGESTATDNNGNTKNVVDHKPLTDEQNQALSETKKRLAERQLQRQVTAAVEGCNNRGLIPQAISEMINSWKKDKSEFNWRSFLKRFIGSSQETFIKASRNKLNKRIEEYAGNKFLTKGKVLMSIDTSGSVSTESVKKFVNEIWHASKLGVSIDVIQCDADLSSIKPFRKNDSFEVYGRGGTDFQPVIDYYNQHLREYASLIYFTDGECNAPTGALRTNSILWCICNDSYPEEDMKYLPGRTIKIPETNEDE